jgi:hypothetical protein
MMLVERLTRTMQISATPHPEFFDGNEDLNQQDSNVIEEQIDSDHGGADVGLAEVEIAGDTRVLSRRAIRRAENALKTSRLSREPSFPNERAPRSNTRPGRRREHHSEMLLNRHACTAQRMMACLRWAR